MRKLILGIDGGGTKSHLGLFELSGEYVASAAWGMLNHELLAGSYEQLKRELSDFIGGALKTANANINDITYAVLGLAGVDTVTQHEIISGVLREIGLKSFILCNDGYLGIAAGCPNGVGICAINGTGTVITAIDYNGVMAQVGGGGDLYDDCGGSSWFGARVIRVVYRELFKCGQPTALTEKVFDCLKITRKDEYPDAVRIALKDHKRTLSEFNRFVFSAAGAGDTVANAILERSAKHYAGGIAYLAKEYCFPAEKPLYITLAGSVFVKQEVKILPQLIDEKVKVLLGAGREIIFGSLKTPPVTGAVAWAFKEAGAVADLEAIHSALKNL